MTVKLANFGVSFLRCALGSMNIVNQNMLYQKIGSAFEIAHTQHSGFELPADEKPLQCPRKRTGEVRSRARGRRRPARSY